MASWKVLLVVSLAGFFGTFGRILSKTSPFDLTALRFSLARFPIDIYTGQALLSPLSVDSIVLSVPIIIAAIVTPRGHSPGLKQQSVLVSESETMSGSKIMLMSQSM